MYNNIYNNKKQARICIFFKKVRNRKCFLRGGAVSR